MKIKFTEQKKGEDQLNSDSWIEEYKSLEDISDEIKEGCTLTILFTCLGCKEEIETKNEAEAIIKICKKCRKGGVKC